MAEISKKKKDRLKERAIEDKKEKKAQRKQVQEVSKEKDEEVKEAIAKKNKDEIVESKPSIKAKKLQHYFRIDRVETKKLEGWKVVKITDKKITSEVAKNQDVVLMEK